MARRHAVRLGIPALVVAGLAMVALWRVGEPENTPDPVATTGSQPGSRAPATPDTPLNRLADLLTDNAIGRQASLEGVEVRQVTSDRTFWVGDINEPPAFAVLDPDVKRRGMTTLTPGTSVTLIGLVRPAPAPEEAMRQWKVDAATARALQERGTYVHVTEIHAVPRRAG